MRYAFVTVDVFTENRFGGNQLAVLPDARGLTDQQMQSIAAEFGYAETTFVLPPASLENDAQVRIFTPGREVPFAGHPNVGTAFALATIGMVHGWEVGETLVFEEKAGLIKLTIERGASGQPVATEFTAPVPFGAAGAVPVEHVAAAASLAPEQIATAGHAPTQASVGLPFTLAEVPDLATLAAAKPNLAAFDEHFTGLEGDALYLYAHTGDGAVQARMFAPLHGVLEDAATGSAAAALTGLLAQLGGREHASFRLSIVQGIEMGRPSVIYGAAEIASGAAETIRIGGPSVAVMEGFLTA